MPSGASTGIYEALELRDGDKSRYRGKGVATDQLGIRVNLHSATILTTSLKHYTSETQSLQCSYHIRLCVTVSFLLGNIKLQIMVGIVSLLVRLLLFLCRNSTKVCILYSCPPGWGLWTAAYGIQVILSFYFYLLINQFLMVHYTNVEILEKLRAVEYFSDALTE